MKNILRTLSLLALFTCLHAQKPAIVASDKAGWHKIGETTVDFTREEDEVAVLLADRFAFLKFKVTHAPIELIDLDVIYEEGDKQNIRIGHAIKREGNESKPIDLKGGAERKIKRIVFRYRTIEEKKGQKAVVEIWGKKTNSDKQKKKEEKQEKKSTGK